MADIEREPPKPPEGRDRPATRDDALRILNYGSSLPLDENVHLEQKTQKPVTFQEVKDAFKRNDWNDGLKKLFHMIFRTKNPAEGLEFLTKNIDAIPARERAGMVAQLEQRNQRHMDIEKRMKISIVNQAAEYSLFTQGYRKERTATAKTVVEVTEDGKLLKDLVKPPASWDDVEKENVVGVVKGDGPLPKGSFVYFDEQGYPVHVADRKLELADVPARPVYRRDDGLKAELSRKTDREKNVEFLKRNLKAGDVLMVHQGGSNEKWYNDMFEWTARRSAARTKAERSFPHVHVMVYLGGGRVAHVTGKGGNFTTVDEVLGDKSKYTAVTAGRMRKTEAAEALAKHVEQENNRIKSYDYKTLASLWRVGSKGRPTGTKVGGGDDSCICTGLVARGAELASKDAAVSEGAKKDLAELAGALQRQPTALAIGAAGPVDLAYSMDLAPIGK